MRTGTLKTRDSGGITYVCYVADGVAGSN